MPRLIKNEVWVLADGRAGNYSQCLGLASELGLEYRVVNISYSVFSFLPNFILQYFVKKFLLVANFATRKKLRNLQYFPKIVISAGRRSALVALYIKNLSDGRTKIAQIMNPEIDFAKFDFVILPKHDEISGVAPNVIQTVGSLTRVDDVVIQNERKKFVGLFSEAIFSNKIKIALLIGGNSKNGELDSDSAKMLVKQSVKIAKNMNAALMVLNSRRTGDKITKIIWKNLSGNFKFFDWKKLPEGGNPYLAITGIADFFIVTGDSVSMISEVCSTGKPVYIFDRKNISAKKHRKFHQELFAQNYARMLNKNSCMLEKFAAKKLQETKRVAEIILRNP